MPGDLPLARLNAQIAVARQDWPDALRRWNAVLAAHPEDAAALKGRGAALWQVRLHQGGQEDDESGTEAAPAGLVDVGRVADQEAQALVTRFESLGQNCEFGLVQRRFGAEPLGLLRWTFVRPLALAKMLETRFAGLAEPDQVDLLRSAWGEWYVRDRLYNMNFHTFHTGYIANEADYLKKQAARLRWLRDKLVDDLDEGSKIFIYKPRVSTRERHIGAIYNGLRRFERARLLCIGLADETAAPGTIRENARGHLNGYLSVHNPLEHGKWDIPFEEWLSLCRATLAWTDAK
jgi:hypothetical protein